MTVRVYKSTDGSAPVLTGQAGSLTTLLDAVLVNGYGAATAAVLLPLGSNQVDGETILAREDLRSLLARSIEALGSELKAAPITEPKPQ